jgi:hypothetical protein
MRWIELGVLAEFADRSGIIRQTAGCSLVGRFEFSQRLEQLQEMLEQMPSEQPWADEYHRGGRFAHVIDRLLELNSLKTDWLTLDMVSTLLFGRVDEDGNILPGWLIELNSPTQTDKRSTGEPATLATMVAGLSESLAEAIELAEGLPAQVTIEIAHARAEMYKTDEQKAEDKKQRVFEELRNDARLEEILGGE